ncbi:hypothetical protein AWRI1631_101280, partial [Saccharomyces cerevisiae AWRI1631]
MKLQRWKLSQQHKHRLFLLLVGLLLLLLKELPLSMKKEI